MTAPALCRAQVLVELFERCRVHPAGQRAEWVPGWPGSEPPRERVWVFEIDQADEIEWLSMAPPLHYTDSFTLTLHAYSQSGGQTAGEAMLRVQGYVDAVLDVCRSNPTLGDLAGLIGILPGKITGPYSAPNTKEPGYEGSAAVTLGVVTRVE